MFRVAIVGRPNVGKSTLFNRLSRSRRALVGNEPGITRDWISRVVSWDDRRFELIDTGGIDPGRSEVIPRKVLEQAEIAIQGSDLILLMVDVRAGLVSLDEELASFLRGVGREFWVVANKVDHDRLSADAYQFSRLGASRIFSISAEHNLGIGDLLDEIVAGISPSEAAQREDEIRVAIVGRPNVGKSSLVNRILGRDRVIVSEVPGTTRDSVDTPFRYEGQNYRIIDTAGIRRKGKTKLMAEKLSVVMARKNIEQADVVLLVLDAEEGVTKLDATIGGYAQDAGSSVLVLVNKWDLVNKDTYTARSLEEAYRSQMRFLDYAPMFFVSAKTGQRVFKVLREAISAHAARYLKIPTPELNNFLLEMKGPALTAGEGRKKARVKYGCQVGVAPPVFVLFLRGGKRLHFSSLRFLSNRLRERYGFFATPLRFIQRTGPRQKRN
jgi:GTP-binding protein